MIDNRGRDPSARTLGRSVDIASALIEFFDADQTAFTNMHVARCK
ncbi:hypothetical protein [Burkholderia sp. S171]|nr:hypothetical protein [Burkholderia sp. S171]